MPAYLGLNVELIKTVTISLPLSLRVRNVTTRWTYYRYFSCYRGFTSSVQVSSRKYSCMQDRGTGVQFPADSRNVSLSIVPKQILGTTQPLFTTCQRKRGWSVN